ncbi:MAG: LCP family protein [Oscillospiraceae bacterium]|jgi:LCP family protein required for cell wall assembly|nr:LCP family protein [Oscillospiraceae bacterium]
MFILLKKRTAKKNISEKYFILFFAVIGAIGCGMIYIYNVINSFNYDDLSSDSDNDTTEISDNQSDADNMVLNVLLLGIDGVSKGDKGRSDSILIVSLNRRHKKIKIASIMRDTWVKIPGYSNDRINSAYSLGGPKLTIDTVERNFGIGIDRYVSVNFDEFSKVVDNLGGIDIELTASEIAYINAHAADKQKLKGSGTQHLSGSQTLQYARDRDSPGSDYDRTERQRNIIVAGINKLKQANLLQLTKIVSDIAPMVTTNFKTSEITQLSSNALTYLDFETEQFRIPSDDNVESKTIDQKMVLVIKDLGKAKKDLRKFLCIKE